MSNNKKLFSIIIPVYKVEECIRAALDSVFSQGIDESIYEVIIVNDGTPDNSMQIVEEFRQKHNNVIIINKENGGVSSARNEGIKRAQGKYIAFVDADDYLSTGSLDKIMSCIDDVQSEVVILKSFKDGANNEVYKWNNLFKDGEEYCGVNIIGSGYFRGSACGCIFSKDFLNKKNILFADGVANGEDTIFMSLCMMYATKVRFVDVNMYNVVEREGSASRSYTIDRIVKMTKGLEYIQDYINNNESKLSPAQLGILNYLKYDKISGITIQAINIKKLIYNDLINQTKIKSYLPVKIKNLPMSKLKVIILNTSYKLFYLMVKIKNDK